jgi:hypothetical protein
MLTVVTDASGADDDDRLNTLAVLLFGAYIRRRGAGLRNRQSGVRIGRGNHAHEALPSFPGAPKYTHTLK